jgi:membrane protein DedA with SNARE-associated domain
VSIWAVLFFTGIGIPPLPEEGGILYAASVAAAEGTPARWWFAWPAASLGIMCADAVLYGIGRAWGPALFNYRWVQRLVKAERRQRFERRFQEHGIKILLTARFLPPLRTGVFIVAGALRYSFLRFLLADSIYALFGVGLFFAVGAGIVAMLDVIRQWVGHWTPYVVGAAVGIYVLYRYYRHLKVRELREGVQPPLSVLEVAAPEAVAPPGATPAEAGVALAVPPAADPPAQPGVPAPPGPVVSPAAPEVPSLPK